MDTYEATKIVMSRIQTLDPENASRIMGYILIQDQGEKEMIRLAFGPETLLVSCINQAKAYFRRNSNPSPNPPSPFPQNSPRILIPNNGFHSLSSNPTSPAAAFPRSSPRPISYASVVNGSVSGSGQSNLHFYGGNEFGDEFVNGSGSFFDDPVVDPVMSPSGRSDSLVFPYREDSGSVPHHPFHRRSCSVNDAAFLSNLEEMGVGGSGFGWRPCMYFARGFCKNGSSCKFSHSDGGNGEGIEMSGSSSPGNNGGSGFDELLRMKALQQQRLALMASGHHPFGHSKSMSFVNDNLRNDFSHMGLGCSSSRQIYLTFPADSTFKEEDVSSYFSMFGPVQDVRIPYQQKRMFGFVTFLYPETVKLILAKGNPHFVCDSRVLVKPYKEKGKIPDKKLHQLSQLDSGEYSACLSPGIDSREHLDLPFGPRNLINSQEMMLRRKLEQEAELQHAIELQNRRMMNLQLMDLKNQHEHRNHNFLPSSPSGAPIFSPRQAQFLMNQNPQIPSSDFMNGEEVSEANDEKVITGVIDSSNKNNDNSGDKEQNVKSDESGLPESLEHILPDNLFSSPTKLAAEQKSAFSQAFSSSSDSMSIANTSSNKASVLLDNSPLGMAPLKSCYFQTPRKYE